MVLTVSPFSLWYSNDFAVSDERFAGFEVLTVSQTGEAAAGLRADQSGQDRFGGIF